MAAPQGQAYQQPQVQVTYNNPAQAAYVPQGQQPPAQGAWTTQPSGVITVQPAPPPTATIRCCACCTPRTTVIILESINAALIGLAFLMVAIGPVYYIYDEPASKYEYGNSLPIGDWGHGGAGGQFFPFIMFALLSCFLIFRAIALCTPLRAKLPRNIVIRHTYGVLILTVFLGFIEMYYAAKFSIDPCQSVNFILNYNYWQGTSAYDDCSKYHFGVVAAGWYVAGYFCYISFVLQFFCVLMYTTNYDQIVAYQPSPPTQPAAYYNPAQAQYNPQQQATHYNPQQQTTQQQQQTTQYNPQQQAAMMPPGGQQQQETDPKTQF